MRIVVDIFDVRPYYAEFTTRIKRKYYLYESLFACDTTASKRQRKAPNARDQAKMSNEMRAHSQHSAKRQISKTLKIRNTCLQIHDINQPLCVYYAFTMLPTGEIDERYLCRLIEKKKLNFNNSYG